MMTMRLTRASPSSQQGPGVISYSSYTACVRGMDGGAHAAGDISGARGMDGGEHAAEDISDGIKIDAVVNAGGNAAEDKNKRQEVTAFFGRRVTRVSHCVSRALPVRSDGEWDAPPDLC